MKAIQTTMLIVLIACVACVSAYGEPEIDIDKAMEENYSTGGTMGVGLPGTKRLMDDFQIDAHRTQGTKVTVKKWI